VIPKTANPIRLPENINVYDFKQSDEDYQKLTDLDKGARFMEISKS
jgi:diketogulonate reductase-like aldo/keto reductase